MYLFSFRNDLNKESDIEGEMSTLDSLLPDFSFISPKNGNIFQNSCCFSRFILYNHV